MLTSAPLVTILIPAYNAARSISQTLDSVLAQDYPHKEVVICDNLSTDETAAIVRSYAPKGVRYHLNSTPGSAEQNWNYALEIIGGEFIALYHADDVYLPSIVREQVEFLISHPDVAAVFTMANLINEEGKKLPMRSSAVSKIPECNAPYQIFDFTSILNAILKNSNFIKTPSLLTRKDTFEKVGKFNLKYKSSADLDLWLRMAASGSIGIINKPLLHYRVSTGQGSTAIYKDMTELPDYYRVAGHYLKEHKHLITPDALAWYEMLKGGELILCALNLLKKGESQKGKESLKQALNFSNFRASFSNKRMIFRYFAGYLMLISCNIGLGKPAVRFVNSLYDRTKSKWNKPL